MTLFKKLYKNTWIATALTNSFNLLSGIATGIITARLLLPEGRGALAAVLFWPQLIGSIGFLSLNEAVTYRVSQPEVQKNITASVSVTIALVLALLSVSFGYFLLPCLLGAERGDILPLARMYLILLIPFQFTALCLIGIDHGDMKFIRYNLIRLSVPFLYLVGLGFIWFFNFITIENVIWANITANIIATLFRIFFSDSTLFQSFSWKEARILVTSAFQFHLTALLVIIASQIDRLIVLVFWDNTTVGIYSVAFTVASSALGIITQSFHIIIFPNIARREGLESKRDYLAKGLRHGMLLIIMGTIPLGIISPWIIPFLFGAEFKDAVIPCEALLLAYLPLAMRQITIRSLRGLGEWHPGIVAELISLIVFLIGMWCLGNKWGLAGVGFLLFLANVISFFYLAVFMDKHLGLKLRDWWGLDKITFKSTYYYFHRVLFSI